MEKEIKKGESWRRGYAQGYEEGLRETAIKVDKHMVDFLSTLEGKKLLEKIKEDIKNTPMGISQWREHGKKNGYWDYFLREIKKG